jgi:DNA-binding SARP family transcriptional activator
MLNIFLFGRIRLEYEQVPISVRISPSVQAILAYLLLQPKRNCSRDMLMELSWGDRPQGQARSCLNTALWRLRSILEPEGITRGTYLRTGQSGDVGFNWDSPHWLDLITFQNEVSAFLNTPLSELNENKASHFETCLALYTGDLLEGLDYDWALREQERAHTHFLKGLSYLLLYCQNAHLYEKAISIGQQILRYDPMREDIHRQLITLYLETGQRVLAVQQYETCRFVLQSELGIQPMPETNRLYHQAIADQQNSTPTNWLLSPENERLSGKDFQQTIANLKTILVDMDNLRAKVKQTLLVLENSKKV